MLIDEINKSMKIGNKSKDSSIATKQLGELKNLEAIISTQIANATSFLTNVQVVNNISDENISAYKTITTSFSRMRNNIDNNAFSDVAQNVKDIDEALRSGNEQLQRIWGNYREEQFIPNNRTVKALINFFDEESLDRLAELQKKITEKSIGDQNTITAIDNYNSLTKSAIGKLNMSSAVKDFLIRLSDENEEIRLDEVTNEIFNWLKNNKMLKKIKLSI